MIKAVIFDLDGTLAESKTEIKSETAVLVSRLLKVKKVGIIGGGSLERFKVQILNELNNKVYTPVSVEDAVGGIGSSCGKLPAAKMRYERMPTAKTAPSAAKNEFLMT